MIRAAALAFLFFVALGIGAGALVCSCGLPAELIRTQMERLDEEVNRRRTPAKGTA